MPSRGPGREVVFDNFMWSGRNSIAARARAAGELQEKLRRLLAENPGRKVFLAVHSHGGNVVLYALRDPALSGAVSGLVCFGVPLLDCTPSGFPKIGSVMLLLNIFPAAALLQAGWMMRRLGDGALSQRVAGIDSSGVLVAIAVCFSIVATLVLSSMVGDLLRKLQARVRAGLELPDLDAMTFYVTADGDEAALGLKTLRFLAPFAYPRASRRAGGSGCLDFRPSACQRNMRPGDPDEDRPLPPGNRVGRRFVRRAARARRRWQRW